MSNSRYYQRRKKPVINIQGAVDYYYSNNRYNCMGFTSVKLHYTQIKLIMTALEHYNFIVNNCFQVTDFTKDTNDSIFLTYHMLLSIYADRNNCNFIPDEKITISNDFKYHIA